MRPIIGLITAASLLVCGAAGAVEDGREAAPPGSGDAGSALAPLRPVKSPEVAEVQRRLKALGYGVGAVDGRLGPRTRAAIDTYLTERGLPAIGWISPDLIAEVEGATKPPPLPRPVAARSSILHDAQRDIDPAKVVVVQSRLKDLGFFRGAVDGVVSPGLSDAISAYQKSVGMPVTGWIFPDLVAEMAAPAGSTPPAGPDAKPVISPVKTWRSADLVGKTLHAQPGDLLGTVADIVIGGDGMVAGVVAAVTDLYGYAKGETLIPWGQVAPSIGRPLVILPISADQLRLLRRDPPPFRLGLDQMLGSRLIGAPARVKGAVWGEVDGAVFEPSGKISQLKVRNAEEGAICDVPAAAVTLVPADDAVELGDAPVVPHFESDAS